MLQIPPAHSWYSDEIRSIRMFLMSPRHQLILSVAIVAAVIAIAWFMLFKRNVLTPPVNMPAGPTLPELGKEFDASLEQFNKLLVPTPAVPATTPPPANTAPTPPAASDDVRTPAP